MSEVARLAVDTARTRPSTSAARTRADAAEGLLGPSALLALQRRAGNRAVASLIYVQRVASVTGRFTGETPDDMKRIPADLFDLGYGPRLGADFAVHAEFEPIAPNTTCAPGEYRQYVKGSYKENGIPQSHVLAGGPMRDDTYLEDVQGDRKYGYRDKQRPGMSFWKGGPRNGCELLTNDAPSTGVTDGTLYEIDLHFLGRLIDRADDDNVLSSREWIVSGRWPPTADASPPAEHEVDEMMRRVDEEKPAERRRRKERCVIC